MKVYVMTRMDINSYGYNPKSVEVSTDLNHLNEVMKAEYLAKAKDYGLSEAVALDEEPDKCAVMFQFCENNYAYIEFDYYWDIFEAEVS